MYGTDGTAAFYEWAMGRHIAFYSVAFMILMTGGKLETSHNGLIFLDRCMAMAAMAMAAMAGKIIHITIKFLTLLLSPIVDSFFVPYTPQLGN